MYYASKKYNLAQQPSEEAPICIYSEAAGPFSPENVRLLQSLERVNYTNFRVVLVDNYSPDDFAFQTYQLLQQSQMRLRNRITIVRSLQRLDRLAALRIWVSKFCK